MTSENLNVLTEAGWSYITGERLDDIKNLLEEKITTIDNDSISASTTFLDDNIQTKEYVKNLLTVALGFQILDFIYFQGVTIHTFGGVKKQ